MSRRGLQMRSLRAASWLGGLLVLLGLLAPAMVRAEENGLKIGDGRLHPFFDLEGRYDTAAQINLGDDGKAHGLGDFILHFRPGFKLDVPSNKVALTLQGEVEYLVYLGLNSNTASKLDRLQAEANAGLGFFRGSVVNLELGDHFTRSNQSTNVGLSVGALALFNDANATVNITPGSGSLTISPSYHFQLEALSPLLTVLPTAGQPSFDPSQANYIQHRVLLENRWRFLPKTAFLLDGEFDARSYNNDPAQNLSYFDATTGISGLITTHFGTVARVGYSRDITKGTFGSVIGQLEGTYLPNETSLIRLGFDRTFQPVAAPYTSYEDDRGYLEGRMLLIGRLTLHAYASIDYLGFRGSVPRNDLLFQANIGADFAATRWLVLGLGDALTARTTDLSVTQDPNAPALNLVSDQVFARATFTY